MIVDVALTLLNRRGLPAVTMRRVARRLGVGAMTLYTYVDGQDGLRHAITQHGFDLLAGGCSAASTLGTPQGWRGSAKHYIRFAVDNPNLYKLMFDTPVDPGDADEQLLYRGFQSLVERVREQMAIAGATRPDVERRVRLTAGRYWIALHGLASLAIAGRLRILDHDLDTLLDAMLERVAPT